MPDKIWLHKDTKYSTADTVCGYQYKFLAENEGIENFVEYIRSDAFIEKACEWLSANLHRYDESIGLSVEEFVERFKKAVGK